MAVQLFQYSHFAQSDAQLFSRHGGKELVTVQDGLVMTFDQHRHLLEECVGLICDCDLTGKYKSFLKHCRLTRCCVITSS